MTKPVFTAGDFMPPSRYQQINIIQVDIAAEKANARIAPLMEKLNHLAAIRPRVGGVTVVDVEEIDAVLTEYRRLTDACRHE